MTNINLLPWRVAKREQEKTLFLTLLGVTFGVSALLVFIFNYCVGQMVDSQSYRNQRLKNEISLLDNRIKTIAGLKKDRLALIARMKIVEGLRSTRPLTIHLFDEVIKIIPPGVVVTKIERKGNEVTVLGYSESNTNVSDMMRNIEHNQWIRNPDLQEIKKAEQSKQTMSNEFKLSFILRKDNNKK